MPDKKEVQTAYQEFLAILYGGQDGREFHQSAHTVLEFFEKLLAKNIKPLTLYRLEIPPDLSDHWDEILKKNDRLIVYREIAKWAYEKGRTEERKSCV